MWGLPWRHSTTIYQKDQDSLSLSLFLSLRGSRKERKEIGIGWLEKKKRPLWSRCAICLLTPRPGDTGKRQILSLVHNKSKPKKRRRVFPSSSLSSSTFLLNIFLEKKKKKKLGERQSKFVSLPVTFSSERKKEKENKDVEKTGRAQVVRNSQRIHDVIFQHYRVEMENIRRKGATI